MYKCFLLNYEACDDMKSKMTHQSCIPLQCKHDDSVKPTPK